MSLEGNLGTKRSDIMEIRKATISDAEGIARVHVDCWRTTYNNIVPDSYLDRLSYEKRTDLWIENISREDNHVFVALNERDEIIGFADGSKRETNSIEQCGDLTSIYVLEKYQGLGIGNRLVRSLFSTLNNKKFQSIFVEVLEANSSKDFYEKLGAEYVRSEKINIAGAPLTLLVYVWEDISMFRCEIK